MTVFYTVKRQRFSEKPLSFVNYNYIIITLSFVITKRPRRFPWSSPAVSSCHFEERSDEESWTQWRRILSGATKNFSEFFATQDPSAMQDPSLRKILRYAQDYTARGYAILRSASLCVILRNAVTKNLERSDEESYYQSLLKSCQSGFIVSTNAFFLLRSNPSNCFSRVRAVNIRCFLEVDQFMNVILFRESLINAVFMLV